MGELFPGFGTLTWDPLWETGVVVAGVIIIVFIVVGVAGRSRSFIEADHQRSKFGLKRVGLYPALLLGNGVEKTFTVESQIG
jgi:hypothetical protein